VTIIILCIVIYILAYAAIKWDPELLPILMMLGLAMSMTSIWAGLILSNWTIQYIIAGLAIAAASYFTIKYTYTENNFINTQSIKT